MHVVNASNWPQYVDGTYYSGNYPRDPFSSISIDQDGVIHARRDHFGVEPLYYAYQNNQFIFGSDLPSIISQLPKHPEPNIDRILSDLIPFEGTNWTPYTNETYYEGIFRVEPGHILTVKNNSIKSTSYWILDPEAPRIQYKNNGDYVDHFAELLNEAIASYVSDKDSLALELSGGLDSSTVLVAAHLSNLNPELFSHVAPENSEEQDDLPHAQALLQHLNIERHLHTIGHENFNLISVLNQLSSVFAGAPPYVFFMLANNIHQAVAQRGHTKLLSGFGGDECVSGHAIRQAFFPQLLKENFYQAWREMRQHTDPVRSIKNLLRYAHPRIFNLKQPKQQSFPYYQNLQHLEYDLLQGPRSHQVRMRVEYSSITAKVLGFSYAYPLLYPKLIEFYHRLPWNQKRRDGVNRYLIRQYLKRHAPEMVWSKSKKGGGIMPATIHISKKMYREGLLDEHFSSLPFSKHISLIDDETQQLLAKMDAYMFKQYWRERNITV